MTEISPFGLFDPTTGPVSLESTDFFICYYNNDEIYRSVHDPEQTLEQRLISQRGVAPHHARLFALFARDSVIRELT